MLIPIEKVDEAKKIFDGRAIQPIVEHFGLRKYNEKEQSACCPWHDDKTPSFIWNPKNNSFHCFSCNRNYGILDLYRDQGMTYLESVEKLFKDIDWDYNFVEKGLHSQSSYKYPKHEKSDRTQVEGYMELRSIGIDTLNYLDIQSDSNNNITFHYYDSNDVLKTVKYRPARKITKGESKNWFQKDVDNSPLLYNMNRIDPTMPLVITEGEIDTASVAEAGYKNVVSIPNGCGNEKWIEYNWEWLEQFNKIILWFDNDEPGIKARTNAIHRLGTWRTYYINMEEYTDSGAKIKDANELLYFKGKDLVLKYIDEPFEVPVENVTDLSKAEDFNIEDSEGLYTGIKDLDNSLYKLIFGTLNIVTGKSGCVDESTEFFNGYEWKKISDYKEGDKVLQYLETGEAKLVEPLQYHKYLCDNLWEIKTKYGVNQCLSDEHNVYYLTSKNNLYSKPFLEVKKQHENAVNGFAGRFINSFCYNASGIDLSDNEILLMLAVICDGNFNKNNNTSWCRVNLKKQRKINELQRILELSKIPYKKTFQDNGYTVFNFNAPIKTKEFDKRWYQCSSHQLKIIADNVHLWDGDFTKKDSKRFFTTSKASADFIQFAYSACGYRASLKIADRRGRLRIMNGKKYNTKSVDYIVSATKRNTTGITCDASSGNSKIPINPYKTKDGFKYCFTVPSGMWIMRRGGNICVTGNSGKSVFVNQVAICQALHQGYDVFVFSGELPPPILRNWVETNMIGRENITMQNNHIRVFHEEQKAKMRNWYKGRIMVYDDDYNTTATALLNKMEEMARKCGTKVFLIDNLMMVDLECGEESRLQAEKEFVNKLIFFAKKYNVLLFLVAHPRKTGELRLTKEDIAGSGNIVNLAHMVFSVHRYTDKEKNGETNLRGDYLKGKEPKAHDSVVEVLKNRITGVLPMVDMFFDYNSYRFYRTPEELWLRYKWDTNKAPIPNHDPNPHNFAPQEGTTPL